MPVDPRTVARKLKQARELQSLSVSEVSEATSIAAERIALVESGESAASGDEVLILANFYRHDFRDFLDDNRPGPFEQTAQPLCRNAFPPDRHSDDPACEAEQREAY